MTPYLNLSFKMLFCFFESQQQEIWFYCFYLYHVIQLMWLENTVLLIYAISEQWKTLAKQEESGNFL